MTKEKCNDLFHDDLCDCQDNKTASVSDSPEFAGCVVDLTKIAELGQAHAQFELIRTMATEAQTRFGKHLELCDVELMGDIAKDANEIMGKLMAAFDRAK